MPLLRLNRLRIPQSTSASSSSSWSPSTFDLGLRWPAFQVGASWCNRRQRRRGACRVPGSGSFPNSEWVELRRLCGTAGPHIVPRRRTLHHDQRTTLVSCASGPFRRAPRNAPYWLWVGCQVRRVAPNDGLLVSNSKDNHPSSGILALELRSRRCAYLVYRHCCRHCREHALI